MRDLPRSAALAAWGSAVLSGTASIDDAVSAIQGDDLPHALDLSAVPFEAPVAGLVGLFAALRRRGVTRLRLLLPAEGDLAGLPGPPTFNTAALDVGECVVVRGRSAVRVRAGRRAARPPGRRRRRPGHPAVGDVVRRCRSASRAAGRGTGRPRASRRRSLLTTLQEASATLEHLDVAAWGSDPAPGLDHLRHRSVSADMPPGTPSRAAQVLDLAWRVRTVVELARRDDGGAVNTWESQQRLQALRRLDVVSRHAVVAAVNAALEPAR